MRLKKEREMIQRIKEVRLSRGISQQKLAELSGIRNTNISGYETGHRYPSLNSYRKMLKALTLTKEQYPYFSVTKQQLINYIVKIKEGTEQC